MPIAQEVKSLLNSLTNIEVILKLTFSTYSCSNVKKSHLLSSLLCNQRNAKEVSLLSLMI